MVLKKRYLVPLSKHFLVQDNDFIKAGEALSDGSITPADILSIQGPTAVQEYLVNEHTRGLSTARCPN